MGKVEDEKEVTPVRQEVVTVTCCGECPFRTHDIKCEQSDIVEIDEETMDGDLPSICPMMSGRMFEKDSKFVKLAHWILERYPDSIDD